jgi:hypothetical protein
MTNAYLLEPVEIAPDRPLRLSPNALRSLAKATGRSLSDLLTDEADEANRVQVIAFAELYRRADRAGHMPDAGALWEMAGAVDVEFNGPENPAMDPTEGASSTTSPPSADIGE